MLTQNSEIVSPALRGYLHLVCALLSPFALLLLLSIADSTRGVVGGAIFGVSIIILYSTSATYHLFPFGRRLQEIMRRLDHAVIYLFIAGAYAPFALNLLSNAWGIAVLSVVSGFAGLGFISTLVASELPRRIRVGLYLGLGWVGIAAISELVGALSGKAIGMLILSGLLFSVGGIMYATKRPDPFPLVFGYHEVFHTLQVTATVVLYLVVANHVLGL
jgi:hemolysin III